MNKNLTEIAFILDRSGSMGHVAEDAIAGFNQFLTDQQDAPGHARLTLVLFDDEYLVRFNAVPVEEVLPLDHRTYVPRNCTALLDAIGRTIDNLGARLKAIPQAERPGTVIVAILTDGLENASQHFTWKQVSAKIKHQTTKYDWQFLFLGANQDAIATASQLNIAAINSAMYQADAVGTRTSQRSASRKILAMRAKAAGRASAKDLADFDAPMSDLVEEEDRKGREK